MIILYQKKETYENFNLNPMAPFVFYSPTNHSIERLLPAKGGYYTY